MTVDRSIALFGTTEPPPEQVELHAGPISVTFENGALRWVRLNGVEVVRGIAFLVRDRIWDTAPTEMSNLKIDQNADGFRVTFDAMCRNSDGELPWSAEIVGDADGSLRFAGTATPPRDFVTCRTGFVLLHPLRGVVGCPVEITDAAGAKRPSRFPTIVDPEPCFTDIRAMTYDVAPGVTATFTMDGDAWETEDHRNWLDASFKTYVRPMRLPYPYTLKGGETITQSVTIAFSGAATKKRSAPVGERPVAIALSRDGVDANADDRASRAAAMDGGGDGRGRAHPRGGRPQLLNGRIDPRAGHGAAEMTALADLAAQVGAGLALELIVPCRRDPVAASSPNLQQR